MIDRVDHPLSELFENNRSWAARCLAGDPEFFRRLLAQQAPRFLWIGCSDSRVPANEIVGLPPGALFVHRNVANLVMHTDLNCLSVLQYAVDVLRVSHVIVCGHYGCGGVLAALERASLGLIDSWLAPICATYARHSTVIDRRGGAERADRLCELNVIEQARNVGETGVLQNAWARGQRVTIHAWVYSLADGLLQDLGFLADAPGSLEAAFDDAVATVASRVSTIDRR